MTRLLLAGAWLFVSAVPVSAETITGLPYLSDADTVTISGTRIRLAGIDAPEMAQTCLDAKGAPYRCGEAAREALTVFAAGKVWTCELQKRPDRYGRRVGVCAVDMGNHMSVDINRWLVRQGWALDWPRYSHDRYAADQDAAQAGRRGIWKGSFVPPWDYRHGRLQ